MMDNNDYDDNHEIFFLDADNVKDMRRDQFTRECRGKRMMHPQTRQSKASSRSFRYHGPSGQQKRLDRARTHSWRREVKNDLALQRVANATSVPVLNKSFYRGLCSLP